jgi:uncharacterized protein with gpF-like domain
VTGPVWDGTGVDPWLPQRLAALDDLARTERDIRRSVWAALSDWLIQAARRVLRGDTRMPDVDALHALAPLWRESVSHIVRGEIQQAVGLAYTRLLGEDYPYEQRPFVTRYLSEVNNRLVRIPDEVFDLVAGQVSQGVNLGEGIPQLASRVDNVLSSTESERWPNRAVVIARTETIGALNAGRFDAFRAADEEEEETEEQFEQIWLATDDARTRPDHRAAEGQRVPVGQPFVVGGHELRFPGDPLGPPDQVIQCRCVALLVEQGEDVDMSDRQSRGDR